MTDGHEVPSTTTQRAIAPISWPFLQTRSAVLLHLAETAIIAGAFALAHWLTPMLRSLRGAIGVVAAHLSPWLARQLQPDEGTLRPLTELAWILGVMAPAIVWSLAGIDNYRQRRPSVVLTLLATPLAVGSGLAFASLIIWNLRLAEWSRLFLTLFAALAAMALAIFRTAFSVSRERPVSTLAPGGDVAYLETAGAADSTFTRTPSTVPRAPLESAAPALSGASLATGTVPAESNQHDRFVHDILDRVAVGGTDLSQRALSQELGIALGLTNLLVKKLARHGWITLVRIRPNRVRYLITPEGLAEKARLYRQRLVSNVRFYAETRARIQHTLACLVAASQAGDSSTSHVHDSLRSAGALRRAVRVVIYGTGEVAEIGLMLLQGSGFELVAVMDERTGGIFHGRSVLGPESLEGQSINGRRFDFLLATTLDDIGSLRNKLAARGVPANVVSAVV